MIDDEIKVTFTDDGICDDCKIENERVRIDFLVWKQFGEFEQPSHRQTVEVCENCEDSYFYG